MSRGLCLLALLALAAPPVHAQGRGGGAERPEELEAMFRRLELRGKMAPAHDAERIEILRGIAAQKRESAYEFLAEVARNPRHTRIHPEVIHLLSKAGPESGAAAGVFAEHMRHEDPYRDMAREFLLARAVHAGNLPFLQELFRSDLAEDRFLALRAMGQINRGPVMESAWKLLRDPHWKPAPGTAVSCGTIAASMREFEGAEAAKLLLLLQRDPRFVERDIESVREATRLWARGNLFAYIDMAELADPDPHKRAASARFMGEAGFEAARDPLLRLAKDPREKSRVRAEAARALGRLRIAKGDLARQLTALLEDPDRRLRRSAIAGLGDLAVRESVVALVGQLGGDFDLAARAALVEITGLAANVDWEKWLESDECEILSGT